MFYTKFYNFILSFIYVLFGTALNKTIIILINKFKLYYTLIKDIQLYSEILEIRNHIFSEKAQDTEFRMPQNNVLKFIFVFKIIIIINFNSATLMIK